MNPNECVLLTQLQFERLWESLPAKRRFSAPEDHPLTLAGYVTLWMDDLKAWARVSAHAVHAAEQWERAEQSLLDIAIEDAAGALTPERKSERERLNALLDFWGTR